MSAFTDRLATVHPYTRAQQQRASLKRLTANWSECSKMELGIRIRAIAMFGLFNNVPQDIHQEWIKMRAAWEGMK